MPEPHVSSSVRLSDPVTLELRGAERKIRNALKLAFEQGEPARETASIRMAWAAVQDAVDLRGDK